MEQIIEVRDGSDNVERNIVFKPSKSPPPRFPPIGRRAFLTSQTTRLRHALRPRNTFPLLVQLMACLVVGIATVAAQDNAPLPNAAEICQESPRYEGLLETTRARALESRNDWADFLAQENPCGLVALANVMLTHEVPGARAEAARILSQYGVPDSAGAFIEALLDQSCAVKFHALLGLDRCGWTIERVSDQWEFRVRPSDASDWILVSRKKVPDIFWKGENPVRFASSGGQFTIIEIAVNESGEISSKGELENTSDHPRTYSMCALREHIITDLMFYSDNCTSFSFRLLDRSLHHVPGRCTAGPNVSNIDPPHELITVPPGRSCQFSCTARPESYAVFTPGRWGNKHISRLPTGTYLVEAAIGPSTNVNYRAKNPYWVEVYNATKDAPSTPISSEKPPVSFGSLFWIILRLFLRI